MTRKFYPISLIRRNSIIVLRFNFIYTLTSSFSFYLSVFSEGYIIVHPKSYSVAGCYIVYDSQPKSESTKFYRLQLRLGLQPIWSTPTDSNSGLDSDSAALVQIVITVLITTPSPTHPIALITHVLEITSCEF